MDDLISEVFRKVNETYGDAGPDSLPHVVSTFVLVHAAQGVIDNGGYRYFFGQDWPNNLPYSRFIDAYQAIGCQKQADELARVVSSFPFDNPHLYKGWRKKYMAENYDEQTCHVKGWGENLCGDEEVWEKLEAYVLTHPSEFSLPA
jgi:hypothetical protein